MLQRSMLLRRNFRTLRHFSSATTPFSFKNKHYNVEEHHRNEVLEAFRTDENFRNSMAYSLAMADAERSRFASLIGEPSTRMEEQLEASKSQIYGSKKNNRSVDERPLPRTLKDALRPSSRAIVVTETKRPFRVCDVNKAWEDLCGYSNLESKGQNLGDLLKGPETDQLSVTLLMNQLLQGEEATTVLTNYTKEGRKFRNRLHVGPLYNDSGEVSHFVGVLQEVQMM